MAGTVVICFTDIVDSTAMLNRVGDDTFDALRRSHFELLSREVDEHGGEIVKNLGDGVMVAFGSASDAVAAAAAMQRATDLAGRTAGAGAIAIRIGISAGDAVQEDGDWFGSPVVGGARLCSAAVPMRPAWSASATPGTSAVAVLRRPMGAASASEWLQVARR